MPNLLATLADNKALFDEVKRAVLAEFELTDGVVDSDRNDVQLGQMFRARLVGVQKVEEAFKKISLHRTRKDAPRGVNRAR